MTTSGKNFVIFFILFVLIFGFFVYLSALLSVIFLSKDGINIVSTLISKNFLIQVEYLYKYCSASWLYWIENKDALSMSSHNYWTTKLFFASFVPFSCLFILLYIFRAPLIDWTPFKEKEKIHGDAKWASNREIVKAGLRSKNGMLVGRDQKGYLIADGYQHALLFAPTGSGKGVGFVIPNLLFWKDSVVIHDIKLENYELTSGYRCNKLKQKVFLWNPASPDGISHCYNPLDFVSNKLGKMVDDVQKIANLLLAKQDFWENEARSLIVGTILYLIADKTKIKSLGEVVRTLKNDDVVYHFAVILDTMGNDIHPVAYMNLAAFLQKADKERSSVLSTANSALELWSNPLIDTTTATTDFDVSTFRKVPTTVYVGLTPDNLKRLEPLMKIFYQQTTSLLTAKLPTKEEKYGVMYMMDEFPTLGKMEQFQTGIAYFRGYKIRLFLVIQDTQQLKGSYEDSGMNSFLSNATYRITFAANNYETADLISKLIGNKTAEQFSQNRPKFLDLNPASRTMHVSNVQRALLLPQEVIALPRDQQIILVEATNPIKSKKIVYFKDKFFTKKLFKQIDIPTQEPFIPKKPTSTKQAKANSNADTNPPSGQQG